MTYVAIYERADKNWAAYAPDVPGCMATGATREEAELNFRQALAFHFEGLTEAGLPIPPPASAAGEISVSA